jgi:hypothetical protein
MYSTKIQYPHAVDMSGKPLSRTTLGDPYVKAKREKNARFNGKQLGVKQASRPAGLTNGTVLPNSLFGKIDYKSDPYVPQVMYTKSQPMEKRKLGFGSHDAHKTDEFTNSIRTEVYRIQLRQEYKHINKANAKLLEGGEKEEVAADEEDAPTLYETLHSKKEDLFGNARLRELRKNFNTGVHKLSSAEVGNKCGDPKIIAANKSTCGMTSVTAQFFDKTHLEVGAL